MPYKTVWNFVFDEVGSLAGVGTRGFLIEPKIRNDSGKIYEQTDKAVFLPQTLTAFEGRV